LFLRADYPINHGTFEGSSCHNQAREDAPSSLLTAHTFGTSEGMDLADLNPLPYQAPSAFTKVAKFCAPCTYASMALQEHNSWSAVGATQLSNTGAVVSTVNE
jgi:hypothetical protein